ncbi:hypothetical protein [Chondrinema litorale]|uniref:hypothetical protein n=1 Tax=Chondrinema litorale TaxID=2994555 RepID=UPI00254392E5|nr:hypothetical protein [Chondrinema litorale]UZR93167.1 hypothetical protein OQ292_15005 [Chondrinema litorale]
MIARSPIGQVSLILAYTIFDAWCNGLAISLLISDRLSAFVSTPEEAQETALLFAKVASTALGLGIFIFALITEKDSQGNIKSHSAGLVLAIISFVMSAVGFLLVVIPPGVSTMNWTLLLTVKVFFSVLIAAMSPYGIWHISRNLAVTYSSTFDTFMHNVIAKTHERMNKQLEEIVQGKPKPAKTNTPNLSVTKFNNAI